MLTIINNRDNQYEKLLNMLDTDKYLAKQKKIRKTSIKKTRVVEVSLKLSGKSPIK